MSRARVSGFRIRDWRLDVDLERDGGRVNVSVNGVKGGRGASSRNPPSL